jgi:hypothetical protein
MNDKPKPMVEMITLKQLCVELKVDPREARERLRLHNCRNSAIAFVRQSDLR